MAIAFVVVYVAEALLIVPAVRAGSLVAVPAIGGTVVTVAASAWFLTDSRRRRRAIAEASPAPAPPVGQARITAEDSPPLPSQAQRAPRLAIES